MQRTTAVRKARTFGDADLETLQKNTFRYFWDETNSENGLIADNTLAAGVPSSIAGVGMALTCYPVGVERSWVSRADAARRVLTTLRFFWTAPQEPTPHATGYRGFYYHFLDVTTGQRAWRCELSTMDTAILIAGVLTAAAYFDKETRAEQEVRKLADALYRRVDWRWAQNGGATVSHGWRPETGFLRFRWQGYNEALILYVLGLGAPEHPLPRKSYKAWASTYRWKKFYGRELLYGGPLFMHQLSHLWLDLRGIQDAFMRKKGIDYFENSRRAVEVHQQYADQKPERIRGVWRARVGYHGEQRPWSGHSSRQGSQAPLFRLHSPRCAIWPGRRNACAVGRGGFVAIRSRHRALDLASDPGELPGGERVWARVQHQSDVSCTAQASRLDLAKSLRARPGSRRADDRERPLGFDLAADAKLSCGDPRTHSGWLFRRLVIALMFARAARCASRSARTPMKSYVGRGSACLESVLHSSPTRTAIVAVRSGYDTFTEECACGERARGRAWIDICVLERRQPKLTKQPQQS